MCTFLPIFFLNFSFFSRPFPRFYHKKKTFSFSMLKSICLKIKINHNSLFSMQRNIKFILTSDYYWTKNSTKRITIFISTISKKIHFFYLKLIELQRVDEKKKNRNHNKLNSVSFMKKLMLKILIQFVNLFFIFIGRNIHRNASLLW